MFLYIIIFILIILLIFTNAITDAPNAISTIVATKVMGFKEAAFMSAIFNLIGIIVMSICNFLVADFIFSMIDMSNKVQGLFIIFSAILSTVLFANSALLLGIPTSETHSLIAGITGAQMACNNYYNIKQSEWINIIFGLIFSIIGTYIITKVINVIVKKVFKRLFDKLDKSKIQILSTAGVSFMHGGQDGQKFIGVIIAYELLLKNQVIIGPLVARDYYWIIILVSTVMFIGVSIGGKKIVENVGENIAYLSQNDAIVSDISSIIVLLISTLNGIPISTSHVKTMSVVASVDREKKINRKSIKDIFLGWIYTFPICIFISFITMKALIILTKLI